jgi:hypothetical protein
VSLLTQAEKACDWSTFNFAVVRGCVLHKLLKEDSSVHALLHEAITDAPYFDFRGSALLSLIAAAKYFL